MVQESRTTVGQGSGKSVGPRISDNVFACKLELKSIPGRQRQERPLFVLVSDTSLGVELKLSMQRIEKIVSLFNQHLFNLSLQLSFKKASNLMPVNYCDLRQRIPTQSLAKKQY